MTNRPRNRAPVIALVRDLDLDLGSGQGHVSMHNTRTTSIPDHVTMASRSAEIWSFEIRVISTFREV